MNSDILVWIVVGFNERHYVDIKVYSLVLIAIVYMNGDRFVWIGIV